MTSPDAIPLQELTLYDRDADDLVARAKLDLTTKLPGLVLHTGRTEVALLEAEALIAVERIFAINRLPTAMAIIQARLAGVVRSEGAYATATATFTLSDTLGHTVPAGSRVRLDTGTDVVVFATDADLVVAAGARTATVAITATGVGTGANGATVATALELLDSLFFVETVTLATSPTGGADPEGVTEWLTRAGQRFARLTSVLVLPSHFLAAALEDVRVRRAFVIDKWDATIPGYALGHVTVAVSGAGGVALSAAVKAEILAALSALTRADLAVHVVDPTITTVAVTATVVAKAAFTAAAVIANVTAALTAYLSPDTWMWGSTVYRNELLSLIDATEGVERVVSITVPAADVSLSGVAPLAQVGAGAVTVV